MNVTFLIADYTNEQHAAIVVSLLDDYARDPMGGGRPLGTFTRDNLVDALAATSGAFSVIGYGDGEPVALANCFRALSTFACRPLINIHDLMVASSARGHGISQKLLAYVERQARENRCCKVTLEVLEGNTVARAAYVKYGFAPYSLDDKTGHALLMQKVLVE